MKKYYIVFCSVVVLTLVITSVFKIMDSTTNAISSEDFSAYPTLIIDAGHGGFDGGAVGCDGTIEKEINLDISLKLRDFAKFFGFNVIMTREDDRALNDDDSLPIKNKKTSDLQNRMKIMESTPNSIFVSIHQNMFEEEKYSGTQVFYCPNNEESKILAQSIQSSVVNKLQNDNTRQIKQGPKSIYLLYCAKKTAVLVECGFLSNQAEVKLLNDDEYQKSMAFSVACGIIEYIENEDV